MEPHNEPAHIQAAEAFTRLLAIMDRLRKECPWDQKQTMDSLRYLTLEEAFELSEAVLEGDMQEIKKELGDLLLHIVFYARIASETQAFTVTEVIQTLCEKLIYRHPHIYGQQKAESSEAVEQNWEKLKLKERKNKSVLDGVPNSLPSLIKAVRIKEKARRVGFDFQEQGTAWQKVQEEMEELMHEVEQPSPTQQEKIHEEFGDLLFALASYASWININPEDALEKANKKFIKRFKHMEQQLARQGKQITQVSQQELLSCWDQAKKADSS
ncbi:MAG: nucleoside triphosphate pyrophosphohydrolase [Bacteroidota bacterium]